MAKLPKALIKKYGISKKAWSVFRGQRKRKRSSPRAPLKRKRARRSLSMARRKRKSYRAMSKNVLNRQVLWMGAGAGLSGAAEGLVNQVSGGRLAGNLGAGVAGFALASYTKGIPSLMGKGILIKAIGDLVEENVAPRLLGSLGVGSASPNSSGIQLL